MESKRMREGGQCRGCCTSKRPRVERWWSLNHTPWYQLYDVLDKVKLQK